MLSFISKSLIWARANWPNVLLKTRLLQKPWWPFLKSKKNALKFPSLTENANLPQLLSERSNVFTCKMQNGIIRLHFIGKLLETLDWKESESTQQHYAWWLNKTLWNMCTFCKKRNASTCHTTGSMCSTVRESQTLNTRVWEAEVRTLAMMASRMENGSMV